MKIGILTIPLHTNYGGILQAYALQTVLKRMGHEVSVLDKTPIKTLPFYRLPLSYLKRGIKKYILFEKIQIFQEKHYNKSYRIISQNTQKFIDKYIQRIEVKEPSKLTGENFDALIVGSDQIWRPLYYPRIEDAFLNFAKDWEIKRISYAASFGTDFWEYSAKQTKQCKELARLFDAVSVREDTAIKLCSDYLGIKAKLVLDPTMLLDPQDYINLIKDAGISISEGSLLVSILDESEEKEKVIKELSEFANLIPFRINSRIENVYAPLEERIQPSVEHWLRGFYDARFVITDSFHSCVFSILFKKPFVVIGNKERGMARFNSLLKLFNLEYRLISNINDFTDKCLDKYEVDISIKKNNSIDYLLQNLK